MWNIKIALNASSTNLDLANVFSGQTGGILCIDLLTQLSIIVSSAADESVCVWDIRTKSLRFILKPHLEHVVSVSINPIDGNILTLSHSKLRIFSVNGELLSEEHFNNQLIDSISMTDGLLVLAPGCGDWQDGVVAVTAHREGNVFLWKLRSNVKTIPSYEAQNVRIDRIKEEDALIPDFIDVVSRELYIANCVPKTHRADISCLKLCSPIVQSRIRDLVERSFDDGNSLDLLVGDVDGFVSRWAVQRLDQLPQSDIQSMITKV